MSSLLRSTARAALGTVLLSPILAAPLAAQSFLGFGGLDLRGGYVFLDDGPRSVALAADLDLGTSLLSPFIGLNYWHTNRVGNIRAPGGRIGLRFDPLRKARLAPFLHATVNGQDIDARGGDSVRAAELSGFSVGGGVGGGLSLALDDMRNVRLVVEGQRVFIENFDHWGVTAGLRFSPGLRRERLAAAAAVEQLRIERDRLAAELLESERVRAEQEIEARALAEKAAADAQAEREAAESAARAAQDRAAEAERRAHDALLDLDRLIRNITEIRDTERGLIIVLGQGLFASGQSSLSAQARDEVSRIAAVLLQFPERRIAVEGHTDATGLRSVNQRLSEERAESVFAGLTAAGIDPVRIDVVGFGSDRPTASNETAAGRAQNRRVEIVIIGARRPVALARVRVGSIDTTTAEYLAARRIGRQPVRGDNQ